ncbi:hypothetical protein [uncultured Paraglaciecola sp.]|uniref:hypothetical protein n=1 Tax=uncultured Paraglaciecola sp. TaxID=1765024 RepID=UPI0026088F6E|nr:hypothetical protein [uncultured Paraglaciecola sp.]
MILKVALLILPIVICGLIPTSSKATGSLNFIVMGENADPDSIPRHSRVYARVQNALKEQLNGYGYNVFDEVAATKGMLANKKIRRSDNELLSIARTVREPSMDLVVLFTIYARIVETELMNKIEARVGGRLLSVHTGEQLGSFESSSPRSWLAEAKCDVQCVQRTLGLNSQYLANDVGAVLAEQMSYIISQGFIRKYLLRFNDLGLEEVEELQLKLTAFEGHKSLVISNGRKQPEIWYETIFSPSKMQNELLKLIRVKHPSAQISRTNNVLIVTKNVLEPTSEIKLKPVESDW